METPSEILSPSDRRAIGLRAAGIALGVLVVLLATSPGLPMGWDEGNAIGRAEWIADWGRSWFQQGPPGWQHPLSRQAISEHWQYTTRNEGHPAFYGILIASGHALGGQILPPLTAWRLGPILLFAIAGGAMFYRLSRDYSQAAGLAAVLALLLQPRLFAHAHLAHGDGPLIAAWILTWAAFPTHTNPKRKRGQEVSHLVPAHYCQGTTNPKRKRGQEVSHLVPTHYCQGTTNPTRKRGQELIQSVLFGILLGMTMSTKATGWLAPVPFVLWAALYRDRSTIVTLAIGLPVALATFYLLNPPLWHEPIHGLATFLHLNANRQLNVASFFLGRMYDLHHSLPWYNTLVWTAIAVPVGLLGLAIVGLASILRRGLADKAGILLILNWLILLVVRAMPGTPPHDGIRLFLPAFAFLAAIIGVGVVAVQALACRVVGVQASACRGVGVQASACRAVGVQASACRRKAEGSKRSLQAKAWTPTLAVLLIFLTTSTSLFWYAPQWLSYYNLVIGGLPGATRAGMEPTYYWDSLDNEVLDWLDANTADDEKVRFGSNSAENLDLMRTWGTLPVEHRPDAPGRYRWYVIQRRPSASMPPDQWLLKNAEPVYKKYIHPYGCGPWQLNVPLLEIYRYEDYQAAVDALESRLQPET